MASGRGIHLVALLVADYDRAIDWFARALGFVTIADQPMGPGKRWVVVAPEAASAMRLLLAQPKDDAERAALGQQAGGRVFLFMDTDDFARDYARMLAAGVHFREAPRDEPYGTVAVFEDVSGNPWDLIQPKIS